MPGHAENFFVLEALLNETEVEMGCSSRLSLLKA